MRGALRYAFAVAVVALLAPASALAKTHVGFVEHDRAVPANATATFTSQCPRSLPHAVGGELGYLRGGSPGSLALAATYPKGKRGWVVAVQNLTAQAQSYFDGVTCVSGAKIVYPRGTFVANPPDDGVNANCRHGATHIVTGFFGPQSPGDLGKGLLADVGALHGLHGADIGIRNSSPGPLGLFGGAVCTSKLTASPGFSRTVQPGQDDGAIQTCPKRAPIAVGGFVFPNSRADRGAIVLDASSGVKRGEWDVGVRNLSDHPVSYSAGAMCIS